MVCKRLQIFLLLLFALFSASALLWGQSDRGTITGTVSDSSGAVMDSVEVVATQVTTGEKFKAVSNDHGFYSLLDLPIGAYNVSFQKAGFKDLDRTGIVVETQHTLQVDAALTVGTVTETVEVTGTPVLEIQPEVGTNMSAQEMTDLPLTVSGGRDITSFAFAVTPNVSGSEWSSNIAGSQAFTKSVMIDGTSTDSGMVGHIGESEPSMDAVQESQVDTTGLRAEDGRSGGGAFLYEMKSGTNEFHGATFGFLANEFLNANTWVNNWYLSQCATGDTACVQDNRRAVDRYFDYGASGGGPLWKRRKMYIFAAYERYQQADWRETPNSGTVPTAKMLTGDFSELLPAAASALGTATCPSSPCPIMNGSTPYKDSVGNTIYYGSIFSPTGNVYPGNVITDPISPIAQKIASIYQQYYKPTSAGVVNNYSTLTNNEPAFTQTQLSLKYDWAVRGSDHIAVSYIYNLRPRTCTGACGAASNTTLWQAGTTTGGPLSFGLQQTTVSNEYRGSETHTFSPNILNVIAYTFNSFQNKSTATTLLANSTNWPDQIGFGSVDSLHIFPQITLNGSPNGLGETSIGTSPEYSGGGYVAYNAIVNESLSWTKGRHTMKFGMEYRELGFNSDSAGGALKFNYSNNTFAPTNTSVQPYVGSAFANLMLGQVQSANQQVPFDLDSRRKEVAFFGQDDIRINSRLTISADLRWELTRPLHVLGGTWSDFNVDAPNQVFGGIPGAYTWLSNPNGSFETYTDWHQFAPKLGASYQVTSKMVARGSLGVNYVPLGWNGYSGVPYGSAVGFTGLNQVLEVSAQAPAFQWDSSPYPGVNTPPTGADPTSAALQTSWGPASIDPHSRQLGLTENWYAGLQYQLPGNAKVEVSYLGNTGRNLHDGALNPTNFPTWSTYQKLLNSGNIWDWVSNASSAQSAGVPYPYPGFSGEAYFAINPYPQVQACYCGGVFFTNSPLGQSGYNAITVEGTKQRGALNLDMSYNWSRSTGNTGTALTDTWTTNYWWQDPYQYKHEAGYAHINETVKGYLSYGLPFGQGRRFLSESRVLNYAVGGWTAGTIVSYGNAAQLGAVGSTNSYPGWSAVYTNVASHPNFKNQFKTYNPAWNPSIAGEAPDPSSLFVDPSNFSNPTFGQLGNSPTLFSNWRGWAQPQENASLLKKTHFGSDGRYVVTLRAEFFDVFNRHYWNNPNTTFGSGFFGHVNGVSGNRTGQVGARFEW
jgi:Carboxypeptidase regulatory-like domain